MGKTPNPKSVEQLLGEMLADYVSRTGVSDLNPGSLVTQLFETVAISVARASGDAFQILRDMGVDSASGEALKRIAKDENLKEIPARVATGTVTIRDTSFQKISTKIYTGAKAPNIGSTKILVSNASQFPPIGQIYIGRGTPNIEGPIPYSSIANLGSYWEITLSSPTTKFHNTNESVILAQGGVRTISSGTVVLAPGTGASPDVTFVITQNALILDGETEVKDVPVSAQEPGTKGNVPIGAIKQFSTPPFFGATVTNELPFKTGRDAETDEQLRVRIKRARLSRGLGTALAVKSSVIGAAPSDENATVTASEIVVSGGETTLYIDDGTGYEQKTKGVGIEYLVNSALGGETNFQLQTGGKQTSLAKAFVVSTLSGPFDVRGGDRLAVSVGGIVTEHQFDDSDFISPGGATAYEIVASINSNSNLLFEATTSDGAKRVLLRAKQNDNEDIQVVDVTQGRNVRDLLGFPKNRFETLRLFKNTKPLSKDGNKAIVKTNKQSDWSNSIVNGETLIISVDGTAPLTYTITDADFVAEGTHTTVSKTNTLQSWVNVLNAKLTGATAYVVGEQIFIESNLGYSNRAKIEIAGTSSLVIKNMFNSNELASTGKAPDYELSRNTAQIKLNTPLSVGDELSAGTIETEARIESGRILGGTVGLPLDAYLWVVVDDKYASIINTGLSPNSLLSVSKPSSNIIRYTSNLATPFTALNVGDYVIIWSDQLNSNNRLEGRIHAVAPNYFEIKVTATEFTNAVVESGVLYNKGIVFVRTQKVPQKIKVLAGTKLVVDIADEMQQQTNSFIVDTIDDEIFVLKTKTKSSEEGSLLLATFNEPASNLSFTAGALSRSEDSLIANEDTDYERAQIPLFKHGSFSSESHADPNTTYVGTVSGSLNLLNEDPSGYVGFLHPYGNIKDVLQPSEKVEILNTNNFDITPLNNSFVKRIRALDRYYLANPLDFNGEDSFSVILDGDQSNKTFGVPLYRKAKTNTTLPLNSNSFNAFDADVTPHISFSTYFNNFDFTNFKVLMKAKRVLNQANAEDALLFRSATWGKTGERIRIGYIYPTVPNSPINHTLLFSDYIDVRINLKSGAPIPTSIDGTTEWDVTITPNTPIAGVDQVTFTWTGTGTNPALTGLSGGEYVNISSGSELDPKNTGVFRVSDLVGFTPTATSFTVVRKNGEAVAQLNVATLVSSVFSFYQKNNTTALDIKNYVDSNLSSIITAEIVNDSGITGLGVIDLSTEEYTNFVHKALPLLDGVNWILSSNISGSPQFTLKRNLAYTSDVGYAFNDGEEIRLVPTSLDQVERFVNNLAVSGFVNLGTFRTVSGQNKIEIATKELGGQGSVQVVGGTGNKSITPIVGASISTQNYMTSQVDISALNAFSGGQWVKVVAKNKQAKSIEAKDVNLVTITPDTLNFKSTLEIDQRQSNQNLFGKPRAHYSLDGRTFKVEKQGSFTCISWNGVGSSPNFKKPASFSTKSGSIEILKNNDGTATLNILGTNITFLELNVGDYITISNRVNPENNGTFLVTHVSHKEIRYVNPNAISELKYATFTITDNSDISGDDFQVDTTSTHIFTAGVDFTVGVTAQETAKNLANVLNSISDITAKAIGNTVEVQATSLYNPTLNIYYINNVGSPGATASASASRTFSAGDLTADLAIEEGDSVRILTPFAPSNRGVFRVVRVFNDSFYIENKNSVEEEVTLNDQAVAPFNFDNTTGFDVTFSNGQATIQWNSSGTAPDFSGLRPGDLVTFGTDFDITMQGTFTVSAGGLQHSFKIFIEHTVNQSGITISDVMTAKRMRMIFYPYDAVMPEDTLIISSNVLGVNNIGRWPVSDVLSPTKIIVLGVMSSTVNTPLGGEADNFIIEESKPYVGYKRFLYIAADTNLIDLASIAFDTRFQANKINESADVTIESLNRLEFPTTLTKGIDSYVYHTGLIGECNRIVYGDPRDSISYPGVAAAGAEIFIREPLIRRVKMTIDVRLETGIPFALIVEQVRTSVTALINGNELGRSIAISDIIETVNTIPGVRAVAISSPLYDSNHDIIVIQPTEKSKIIDPVSDIGVRRIGS